MFLVLNVSYSDDDLKVLNLNKNTDKNSQPLMNHLNNSNFDDNDSSKEDVTDNLDNDKYIYRHLTSMANKSLSTFHTSVLASSSE